jgi:hypothetical protein
MARKKERVDELLDSLLEGRKPEGILGREGLLGELTKRPVERTLIRSLLIPDCPHSSA